MHATFKPLSLLFEVQNGKLRRPGSWKRMGDDRCLPVDVNKDGPCMIFFVGVTFVEFLSPGNDDEDDDDDGFLRIDCNNNREWW